MRKLKRNIKIQNNENEIKKILETENADFLIEMGKSLYFEGIKKETEKYFEKACEKSQNIEDIIEIANFYKNNEEYEKNNFKFICTIKFINFYAGKISDRNRAICKNISKCNSGL